MKFTTAHLRHGVALVVVIALAAPLLATAQTMDDDWPDDSAQALEVNEGELVFIGPEKAGDALHAATEIELDSDSRRSGWVDLSQCYRNLDPISKTEITWAYREMSGLRVIRSDNIGAVEVGRQNLLLHDVQQGASVCVAARVRILRSLANGNFRLQQGPYHRRFLDGYYPYRVSLELRFARAGLRLLRIEPPAQPGFSVVPTADGIEIDARFEGILTITAEFEADTQ